MIDGAQMHNPAASLFGQAILQMKYVVAYRGGNLATADGHSGAGDLYVTSPGAATAAQGRHWAV
jgi:glycerol-3-phosphate dehydrogenase